VEKSSEERILAKCLRQLNKQGELNATRLHSSREQELLELDRRGERVGREIARGEAVVEQSRRELQEERAFFRLDIETKVSPSNASCALQTTFNASCAHQTTTNASCALQTTSNASCDPSPNPLTPLLAL
jgi:hypothetical protein